jgi:hypothetical protein
MGWFISAWAGFEQVWFIADTAIGHRKTKTERTAERQCNGPKPNLNPTLGNGVPVMIRITALSTTVATTALIALSLIAGPASAQQRGGVQISGNATVIGLANNAVNAGTGFLSKACQSVGSMDSSTGCE